MSTPWAGNGLPPAIILGGPITGMVVARSLYRAGVDVIALGTRNDHFGHSRCCHKAVAADGPNVQPQWLRWLLEEAPEGAVLLPASDDGLELVARNRAALVARGLRLMESDDAAVLALLDKDRTYEIARAAGISTPWTHSVRTEQDLGSGLDMFSFPCGIKPLHRHVFERRTPIRDKLLIAHDRRELDTVLREMLALGLEMQVTELVGGPDHRIVVHTTYIGDDGEPVMEFTHRKLRQRPVHFGVGCYVVGEDLPDVAEAGRRFARAAGVRGMAVTEFKYDPVDGRLRLFECNARFNLAVALLRVSGFDLGVLAYERALGLPGPAMGPPVWGRHLWHPAQDFRSFMDYRREGELTTIGWLRSLLHRQAFSLWAADDPWPSLAENGAAAARAKRLLARRLRPSAPAVEAAPARPALTVIAGGEDERRGAAALAPATAERASAL